MHWQQARNSDYPRGDIQGASDTLCGMNSLTPTQINVHNIPLFLLQKKGKLSPLKPCILSGGELITPFLRHEGLGPSRGSSSPPDWTGQDHWVLSVLAEHTWKHVIVQSTKFYVLTAFSPPAPFSSRQHRQPWTSSIDGRTTPAAPALQSASAGPYTLQPRPGSRAWMEPTATGQWSTEQWSCSSTAVRRLWSESLAAPSYMVAHVRHHPYQRPGVGLSRSPADGPPSQPSGLDTKTPGQRKRWAGKPLGSGGRGSGSHGGKAPGWGGVLSEGCSWGMLL